ncbi:hypothetical protein Q5752_000263 [Cryptotrichosporon argae]
MTRPPPEPVVMYEEEIMAIPLVEVERLRRLEVNWFSYYDAALPEARRRTGGEQAGEKLAADYTNSCSAPAHVVVPSTTNVVSDSPDDSYDIGHSDMSRAASTNEGTRGDADDAVAVVGYNVDAP